MLNIESVFKSFGGQALLENASLQINPGERIGLVGRNGHGKTTLLNMIIQKEFPDEGQILIPNDYRIGFLPQKISFTRSSVVEECSLGLLYHEKDQVWKARKILAGLGFEDDDFDRDPGVFSGGYQVRLNLAKVLVSEPDLLILDEPTNYLDITSIRWITGFLQAWPRELLLVTHDRYFMDAVVTHIAGIHRLKIRKIPGDTSKYYDQVAQDEEVYEKTRANEEKRVKEIETFITRFRAKARLANMVQSRIKTLEKTKVKEKLSRIQSIRFSFNECDFSARQMLQIKNLSFSYDPLVPLIRDFNLTVSPGDRIAIVGRNGKGKTTLLKLITGRLEGKSGSLQYHPAVRHGYFEQTNIQSLNDSFTVEEELVLAHPDSDRQAARNICGAMMFDQDNALKKISVLSGGEKARVMLGKLLVTPLNLLLLDEPTNHLDMETCDGFIEALDNFSGAVIIVTHNEMFLHSLANRLIVFKNNSVSVFEGDYQEFLDKEGWEDSQEEDSSDTPKPAVISKKELRRQRSMIVAKKGKELAPLQEEIKTVENRIDEMEKRIKGLQEVIIDATRNNDGAKIQTCSKQINTLETDIESMFDRLETATQTHDRLNAAYDEQLRELER